MAARSTWDIAFLQLERDLCAGVELEGRLHPRTSDRIRHVRFSLVETGNLRSKPVGGGTQRIVREMSVTLGRCRCRVPQQPPDDLEAESAGNEMGRISVPVVVPAIVRNPRLSHYGAPEFLDLAQRLTRLVAGKVPGN